MNILLDSNKKFSIFPSCIPVRGNRRSIILDVERNRFHLIPNSLQDILSNKSNHSIADIIASAGEEYTEVIQEYFTFLIEHEYIYILDDEEPNMIESLSLSYHIASTVDNFILDIATDSMHDYQNIFSQISAIRCPFIQIRIFRSMNLEELNAILGHTLNKNFESIQLISKYTNTVTVNDWEVLFQQYPISRIDVYGSPNSLENVRPDYLPNTNVYFFSQMITDESHCGVISPSLFSVNIKSFTEAVNYNSCLNGKLSIDKHGNIKNCPSLKKVMGNIKTHTLESIIKGSDFDAFWSITKDQVDICRGCEFRYICTDCRAYVEEPSNNYSKPLKCGYDPNSCIWSNWETLAHKQYAINEYSLFKQQ